LAEVSPLLWMQYSDSVTALEQPRRRKGSPFSLPFTSQMPRTSPVHLHDGKKHENLSDGLSEIQDLKALFPLS